MGVLYPKSRCCYKLGSFLLAFMPSESLVDTCPDILEVADDWKEDMSVGCIIAGTYIEVIQVRGSSVYLFPQSRPASSAAPIRSRVLRHQHPVRKRKMAVGCAGLHVVCSQSSCWGNIFVICVFWGSWTFGGRIAASFYFFANSFAFLLSLIPLWNYTKVCRSLYFSQDACLFVHIPWKSWEILNIPKKILSRYTLLLKPFRAFVTHRDQ